MSPELREVTEIKLIKTTKLYFPRKDAERRGSRLGAQFQFPISEYASKCEIGGEEIEKYIRETTKLLTSFPAPNYFSV